MHEKSDSFKKLETTRLFFDQTEFKKKIFLCTVNANNNIQFRRSVVLKNA